MSIPGSDPRPATSAATTLRFSLGDRVRVTYGIWADKGLVGTVSEAAPSAWEYDWWVKFDEREFPVMFHDRELVKTDAERKTDTPSAATVHHS